MNIYLLGGLLAASGIGVLFPWGKVASYFDRGKSESGLKHMLHEILNQVEFDEDFHVTVQHKSTVTTITHEETASDD